MDMAIKKRKKEKEKKSHCPVTVLPYNQVGGRSLS
jgi:hypothetical protein